MEKLASLIALLLFVVLLGCATVPITGRHQFMIVSEDTEISQGEQAYKQILRQSVLSHNPEALRLVRRVGERIARVANRPNYRWEFNIIDEPDTANAFCLPGGKVAVYTGIFPIAKDEAGLAVVMGHEVAHALARHGAERMSQSEIVQLGGVLLGATVGNAPMLQAYGIVTGVGIILPFSRKQESEADRIGLTLMSEAGYNPHAALGLWDRMEQAASAKGEDSPLGFLATHPGYDQRTEQLRSWMPEAMKVYKPLSEPMASLPSAQSLDSPTARAERELIKRIQSVNQLAGKAQGQGLNDVIVALGNLVGINPTLLAQEWQRLQIDPGNYAALRGVAYLGRTSLNNVLAPFNANASWTDIAQRHGTQVTDLLGFMRQLLTTASRVQSQPRYRPLFR